MLRECGGAAEFGLGGLEVFSREDEQEQARRRGREALAGRAASQSLKAFPVAASGRGLRNRELAAFGCHLCASLTFEGRVTPI